MRRPLTLCLLPLLVAASLNAADLPQSVQRDTETLCAAPSRLPGSPGHLAARAALRERLEHLPGVSLHRQTFPLTVPVTLGATLTVAGGPHQGEHRIHPLWPENVRLNTTPAEGFTGHPIYIGEGKFAELPARSLTGAIAVLEMSAYGEGTWRRAFDFGAIALVLLGSADDSVYLPGDQPIYKPRFYLPDGPLATALRHGEVERITLRAKAEWREIEAENLIAVLPPKDPPAAGDHTPILLVAPYDAMSVVPDLAPGADNAVDAAFALNFLEYCTRHRPQRGLLVALVDGYTINQLGMRQLLAMLAIDPADSTRQAYEEMDGLEFEEYHQAREQIDALGAEPGPALAALHDKKKYSLLQRYVKDAVSPELNRLKEETGDLRLADRQAEPARRPELEETLKTKLARMQDLNQLLAEIVLKGQITPALAADGAKVWAAVRDRVAAQMKLAEARRDSFTVNDRLRAAIATSLGAPAGGRALRPFLIGVDLSDSGFNIGPALWCEHFELNLAEPARGFTRWLKGIIKNSDQPIGSFSASRLQELGLPDAGLKKLLERILNLEAIEGAALSRTLHEGFPQLDEDVIQRIGLRLRAEQREGRRNFYTTAMQILQEELPGQDRAQLPHLLDAILNQQAIEATADPQSFATERLALLTSPGTAFELNGVTWATLEGLRLRIDTPDDTYERLRWERLAPQIRITAFLLDLLLNDPNFMPGDNAFTGWPRWRITHGNVVSETVAETIPRTPVPGLLTTFVSQYTWYRSTRTKGIRGSELIRTEADGSFRFAPFRSVNFWRTGRKRMQAFALAPDGRITTAISDGNSMIAGRIATNFDLNERPPMKPLRAVAFECEELNGPQFRDPRYQTTLNGFKLIDVLNGGLPKRYHFSVVNGQMFGLLPRGTRWQLILRIGTTNNRMALLNLPDALDTGGMGLREALADGLPMDKPLGEIPELFSTRDFYRLDEWRLQRMERAGVVCKAIRSIHAGTAQQLKAADSARAADDGQAYKRAATSALAGEIRVYQAVQDQASDVTRGAIFLLLLLVPFSVAMERLLFASPNIGRQILYAWLIFLVMSGVLWSFHPGFRITSQPAVILLAFLVLLLSLVVVIMVLRKFRADMEELRRGSLAESSGAQTGRGGVIGAAVWLGIANMRKRLMRTLLTGLTIVLVTFSLLCFTSSSTYQERRIVRLPELKAPHSGVLVQHPAGRWLDGETEESVATLVGPEHAVAGRYWVVSTNANWRLHVRNGRSNALASLKAGLGLRPTESRFTGVDRFFPRWNEFEAGRGCYLPERVAGELGLKPGDEVVVAGVPLMLLATFDGTRFGQEVHKLDGSPLLPIDYTIAKDDWTLDAQAVESELSDGNMLLPDPNQIYVSGEETIVLPVWLARKLGASLRSVVAEAKPDESPALAGLLMKNIVYPVYYGDQGGVKVMVSTPLIPKAPRKIFVPILIAALIIFNTMLNSIAERRKEIHIYSSLGLAPGHIGVLFLAEALTYGLMGSVFGYIIGQGVATILTSLDLMGGITLNYSGSNVIMTMGLVLAVVTISALVPAIMAARIASPSRELDWKVPRPQQGVIRDRLPFTVSTQAARGLMAYLHEYVEAHRDGAIGHFTSDAARLRSAPAGGERLRLTATTWLAPYDLGVRQEIQIEAVPGPEEICALWVTLSHGAGPERSWWRLNRTFLGDLRAQLLGWRNVAPERMLTYITRNPPAGGAEQG